MIKVGDFYEIEFSFTQEQVNDFCKISGDFNPLHWDVDFAASTPFKKPIIHGALIASVFSRVMGMEFPGSGSVYLKQVSEFKRPLFVGQTLNLSSGFESFQKGLPFSTSGSIRAAGDSAPIATNSACIASNMICNVVSRC